MRYLICALPLVLAACASLDGGESGILIETTSRQQVITGASCVVSNGNGAWQLVTPARVNTGGVNGDLRVVCNKAGYRTVEFQFRPAPSAASGTSVGIGLGGGGRTIGGSIGFSLPIGGASNASYPPRIAVEMSPL